MKNTDPVLQTLIELEKSIPDSIKPLVKQYKNKGLEGLDEAWKEIVKEAINENQ